MAIDSLHQNWSTPCPIAFVRKGNVIQAKATRALRVGELVVLLFVKKPSSVVTEDEGATIHPKAVGVVVIWWRSAIAVVSLEDEAGSKDVDVRLKVQPELAQERSEGFRVGAIQCCSSFLVHSAVGQARY